MNKSYYYILLNVFISAALHADISWKDANLSKRHSSFLTPDEILERAEVARETERLERERVERQLRQQREQVQVLESFLRNQNAVDQVAALIMRFYQLYQ